MKNKNKKVYMTKKRKHQIAMRKAYTLIIAVMVGAAVIGYAGQTTIEVIEPVMAQTVSPTIRTAPKIKPQRAFSQTIREVTAYNAGDPNQTDSTPCDGAGGNICERLEAGEKVCAANFVPLGTKLEIDGYGECTVLDRMNSRFINRVDIAFKKTEKERAIKFGLQTLNVKTYK